MSDITQFLNLKKTTLSAKIQQFIDEKHKSCSPNEPEDRNTLPKSFFLLSLAALIAGLLLILTATTFTSTFAIVGYVIGGVGLLSLTVGNKRVAAQFNKSDQCEVSRDTRTMTPSGDVLESPGLVKDVTSTETSSTKQRASRAPI